MEGGGGRRKCIRMRILPIHRKLSVLERCRASPFVKTEQGKG